MNIKLLLITFTLLFSASAASSPSVSESEVLNAVNQKEDTRYYYVRTTLERGENGESDEPLTVLLSNVFPVSCWKDGKEFESWEERWSNKYVLNQFNEAVKADGRYDVARIAWQRVYGGDSDDIYVSRERWEIKDDLLSQDHVVIDFLFEYSCEE